VVALLCLFQMWYLTVGFSRHWHVMGAHTHLMAVVFLCGYWVPAVHAWRKQADPLAVAIMSYVLLAAANLLLFPMAR
jgi:hypothetical protein